MISMKDLYSYNNLISQIDRKIKVLIDAEVIENRYEFHRLRDLVEGSIHTSPPNGVEKHMKNLIEWYNENKSELNPIVLATIF